MKDITDKLDQSLTEEQREHAIKRIRDRLTEKFNNKLIMSRADIVATDGKMTKFHFSKIKARSLSSVMAAIINLIGYNLNPITGAVCSTQKTIERATEKFWADIFGTRTTFTGAQEYIFSKVQNAVNDPTPLEQPLALDEIITSINKAKLNKSLPGTDGIPTEFYYMLQEENEGIIPQFLLETFLESFRNGKLPKSMRQIQIRLIFKKTNVEDRLHLKNYRPISLLNCDYKFMSAALARRLTSIMPDLVDDAQAGIPGKFISEPIHFTQSVAQQARTEHKRWSIIFLDFEKAFDSVDHQYTFKMMSKLGLPENFIKWSKLAFIDTSATCIVNGKNTRPFKLPGGGRQGDNLYPLLFALVMHGLTVAIHNSPARGIPIPGTHRYAKIKQYVDDSALFSSSEDDTKHYISAVKIFEQASGMKVNWSKTDGLHIGANAITPPHSEVTVQHTPTDSTTIKFATTCMVQDRYGNQVQQTRYHYLGVMIGSTLPPDHNWNIVKTKLMQTLENRLTREKTDIGKVINCNAVVYGTANYTMSHSADTTEKAVKELESIAKRAVSGKKPILDPMILMMTPEQGNAVPRLNTQCHIDSLKAVPLYKMLTTGPDTDYHYYWMKALHVIAIANNLLTIDHLLLIDIPKIPYKILSNIQHQVYQSLLWRSHRVSYMRFH